MNEAARVAHAAATRSKAAPDPRETALRDAADSIAHWSALRRIGAASWRMVFARLAESFQVLDSELTRVVE